MDDSRSCSTLFISACIKFSSGSTDFLTSSVASFRPLTAFPTCRPTSGNCCGPNSRKATIRITKTSVTPRPNMAVKLSLQGGDLCFTRLLLNRCTCRRAADGRGRRDGLRLQLGLGLMHRLLEPLDRLAEAFTQLGKLACPKDDE